MTGPAFDVLTMGRVSVDLYPEQSGATLAEVRSFAKSLGGSPTNVAVAAARLGRSAAVITRVGADGFGPHVRGPRSIRSTPGAAGTSTIRWRPTCWRTTILPAPAMGRPGRTTSRYRCSGSGAGSFPASGEPRRPWRTSLRHWRQCLGWRLRAGRGEGCSRRCSARRPPPPSRCLARRRCTSWRGRNALPCGAARAPAS